MNEPSVSGLILVDLAIYSVLSSRSSLAQRLLWIKTRSITVVLNTERQVVASYLFLSTTRDSRYITCMECTTIRLRLRDNWCVLMERTDRLFLPGVLHFF